MLAVTTVGNLGDVSNMTQVKLPACDLYRNLLKDAFVNDHTKECLVDKGTLGAAYATIDLFAIVFTLLAITWLRAFESAEIKVKQNQSVTASCFTVFVKWVPKNTTLDELKGFFSQYGEVVDVNIGYDYGVLIQKFKVSSNLEPLFQ